jgi:phospholipid transport system substrate-binding protein
MVRLQAFSRIILTSLMLASALSAPASANSEGPRAESFINTLSIKAIALVSDKVASSEFKRQGFAELLKQSFDMDWIGQFVLGRNWNFATPEQRTEYLRLFEEIIVYTYSKRFNDYSGHQVRVGGHQLGRRHYIFVKSRIFEPARAGSGINVTWRLLPKAESFKIVDVVIEGVSMGITQRNEYNSVIQRNGGKIDALVEAMRENLETLRSSP